MSLRSRIRDYLEQREYRPVYHGICIAVIIAAASFLLYKNFINPGMMMSSDMTWPDTLTRLQFRTFNTWYPFGSTPATSAVQWFFWIFPSSMVARLFHVSAPRYMFLLFWATFSLAGISMYSLAFSTIDKMRLKGAARYAPFVGAVFAALVYMYNPWSIHYFRPYFAYPIYALAPLLILAMVKVYKRPSARNIILLALFATIANTSHNQSWLIGLFGSYFIFYVVTNRFKKEALFGALKVVGGTAALYLLLNAIWTVPYLGAQALGKPLLPFYSPDFTEQMVKGLSTNSYMMNNLRLLSIWSWSGEQLGGGLFLQALTFSLPVLTIVSLIVVRKQARRSSMVNYLGALAIVSLLVATGTNSFMRGVYNWLVFKAPGSSTFGWILRSPERWLFFVAPFVALMLGILVARLLYARPPELIHEGRRRGLLSALRYKDEDEAAEWEGGQEPLFDYPSSERRIVDVERAIASRRFRNSAIVAVLLVIVVLVSMYPKALYFADRVFNPAKVPSDYRRFNDYLQKHKGTPRVAWMPFFPPQQFVYSWAPEKTITWFSVMTSNPSLSSVYQVMNRDSYFNWLQNLYLVGATPKVTLESKQVMLRDDIVSRLFWPFSTRYVVLDTSATGYTFHRSLVTDRSLSKAYDTRYLRAFHTDSDPGYLWAATKTIKADSFFDNLAFMQKLPAETQANLAFTNGRSFFGGEPDLSSGFGALDLESYLTTVNQNTDFEKTEEDGTPSRWVSYFKNPQASITMDETNKVSGERSLKVVNGASKELGVARVVSDELPVSPGSIYTIDTSVKYQNANWTGVSVEGLHTPTNKWIQIAQCPVVSSGTADWERFRCAFWIPPEISKIRPLLGAGWVQNGYLGRAVSWFDDVRISKVDDSLYEALVKKPKAPDVSFTRLSAEKYKVRVRGATAPFVLVQSESYDPLWVAKFEDGSVVDSIPMYATINGYRVDQTGDFEFVLEYQPQRFFQYGLVLTLMTLLFCLLFLLYAWKARPGTLKKVSATGVHAVGRGVRKGASAVRSRIEEPSGSRSPEAAKSLNTEEHEKRATVKPERGPIHGFLRRAGVRIRSFIEDPPRRR